MPSGSTAAGSRSRPGRRCGTGPRSCPQLNESRIGLFGIAGFARALVATRSGRWANARRAAPVSGLALVLLILFWAAIAQLPWSLWLLFAGIVVLDFAVQAAHVSNQHVLTSTYPDRVSSVIGSCMVFYSLGAALGRGRGHDHLHLHLLRLGGLQPSRRRVRGLRTDRLGD